MKIIAKLTIFVCVMLCLGVNSWATTSMVSDSIATSWGYSTSNAKEFITNQYSIKTNSTWNFQYVNISAAEKIYAHGAKFCRMQLQHNRGDSGPWKVYADHAFCKTLCQDGYYGDECDKTEMPTDSCDDDNLSSVFKNNFETLSDSVLQTIDVLSHQSDGNDVILLQITSIKEHGIDVRPIEFYGKDNELIGSVNTRGNIISLCAPGYKKDSSGNCTRDTNCNCPPDKYKSPTNGTCVKCGYTKQSGLNENQVCVLCNVGYIFDGTECAEAMGISNETMRDCLLSTPNDNDFKKCLGNKQ